MTRRINLWFAMAFLLAMSVGLVVGEEKSAVPKAAQAVRIGGVAYGPSTVTVFQDLCRYLKQHDFPADFVLYSNYDALVSALDRGEIQIAWNTPLAHAQYHVRNQCKSQTLAMRDVDCNVRATLVVRADSEIKSLADLAGKKLVLGSSDAAEATVLPLYYLNREKLDLNKVTIVDLDKEFDFKGNPCCSPRHVLKAVQEGRGDAGIITQQLWTSIQADSPKGTRLKELWTSPPFSHCVFTAPADFNKQQAARFTELMTSMDAKDPLGESVMRLEGTKKWLPGNAQGFADLVEALHWRAGGR